jgi:hypothetical protein
MLHFTKLILVFIFLNAHAQAGSLWGIDHYLYAVKPRTPGRVSGNLYEKLSLVQGNHWGISRSLPVTRNAGFTIGIGYSQTDFQKETQGVFPETGQYGFVSVNGTLKYWAFPVSFAISNRSTSLYQVRKHASSSPYLIGLRILYVPSVSNNTTAELTALGGGVQSAYLNGYKNDEEKFRHALLFCITNQVQLGRKAKLLIDPFVGLTGPHFKSSADGFNDLSYGIKFSLQFQLPQISLEWERSVKNEEKKKRLEEKQKEIEEQLKKKPE